MVQTCNKEACCPAAGLPFGQQASHLSTCSGTRPLGAADSPGWVASKLSKPEHREKPGEETAVKESQDSPPAPSPSFGQPPCILPERRETSKSL